MDLGTEPLASDMISSAYDNTDLETCTLSLAYCKGEKQKEAVPHLCFFALPWRKMFLVAMYPVIKLFSGKAVICSVFIQDEDFSHQSFCSSSVHVSNITGSA